LHLLGAGFAPCPSRLRGARGIDALKLANYRAGTPLVMTRRVLATSPSAVPSTFVPPTLADAAVPHTGRNDCLHCGAALSDDVEGPFCCRGCEMVRAVLEREGLDGYYALRGTRGQPAVLASERLDHKWLDALAEDVARAAGLIRLELDIQGIHCSACVSRTGEGEPHGSRRLFAAGVRRGC
jgi:hypothetical protein